MSTSFSYRGFDFKILENNLKTIQTWLSAGTLIAVLAVLVMSKNKSYIIFWILAISSIIQVLLDLIFNQQTFMTSFDLLLLVAFWIMIAILFFVVKDITTRLLIIGFWATFNNTQRIIDLENIVIHMAGPSENTRHFVDRQTFTWRVL